MKDLSYDFRWLNSDDATLIDVEYWNHKVPQRAVLAAIAPGDQALQLTMECTATELPKLTALEVQAAGGGSVTSNDLRRIKVGELTRYAIRYLSWPDPRHPKYYPDTSFANFEDSNFEDPDSDLPVWQRTDVLEGFMPSRDLSMKVHKDVLARIELDGPRSAFATGTVGALYLEAERFGQPPNRWIADQLGISAATASNWLKYARDAGTVPPSARKPRKAGNA